MRIASLTLTCLFGAFLACPAAAEDLHRVVAGMNYRVSGGADPGPAQAVRVRRDTGQVLVRYANARTEWVDAARLASHPQPVVTDAGPYLFVAAALACLLDRDGCALARARAAADATPPSPGNGPARAVETAAPDGAR